ncbi:MAG TPA: GGDEF domain-containing protein [bacterium]|nr:GGDEF domain-containing protein [bacterium]
MNDVFFIVADVMVPTAVSLTGRDTVAAAAKLIKEQRLAAAPVVEADRILGIVTPLQLLAAPPYRPVAEVMTPGAVAVTPGLPLLQAYALMSRHRVDVLPVAEDGKIVGQISATAILRRQSQQSDPLTGLPTSTALRAWAMAALERGHEIMVLFIDLDSFGAVNKILGHVIGDEMLCSVASLLGSLVDERIDLLCRYGGDEFAIATTRPEGDARELAQRIRDVVAISGDMAGGPPRVTASVGVAGGRRAEVRTRGHIATTVEDLLTLASLASTTEKEARRAAEPASRRNEGTKAALPADQPVTTAGRREPRLQLMDVTLQTEDRGSAATVALRLGERESVGRAAGHVHGQGTLFLVAEATLDAIRQTVGDAGNYVLEELTEVPTSMERLVVTVLSRSANEPRTLIGSARAPDLEHAVTKAILAALNRPMARTLAKHVPE